VVRALSRGFVPEVGLLGDHVSHLGKGIREVIIKHKIDPYNLTPAQWLKIKYALQGKFSKLLKGPEQVLSLNRDLLEKTLETYTGLKNSPGSGKIESAVRDFVQKAPDKALFNFARDMENTWKDTTLTGKAMTNTGSYIMKNFDKDGRARIGNKTNKTMQDLGTTGGLLATGYADGLTGLINFGKVFMGSKALKDNKFVNAAREGANNFFVKKPVQGAFGRGLRGEETAGEEAVRRVHDNAVSPALGWMDNKVDTVLAKHTPGLARVYNKYFRGKAHDTVDTAREKLPGAIDTAVSNVGRYGLNPITADVNMISRRIGELLRKHGLTPEQISDTQYAQLAKEVAEKSGAKHVYETYRNAGGRAPRIGELQAVKENARDFIEDEARRYGKTSVPIIKDNVDKFGDKVFDITKEEAADFVGRKVPRDIKDNVTEFSRNLPGDFAEHVVRTGKPGTFINEIPDLAKKQYGYFKDDVGRSAKSSAGLGGHRVGIAARQTATDLKQDLSTALDEQVVQGARRFNKAK